MLDEELIDIIRDAGDKINTLLENISEDFKNKFQIDVANYLTNILYTFDALNEENLKVIEIFQNGKYYDFLHLKDSDDFCNDTPYFVTEAMNYCNKFGPQLIEPFNMVYDQIIPYYEGIGSMLIISVLDGSDMKSLMTYYKHIRHAENCWNNFLYDHGLEKKEPVKFKLVINQQSLDEFIESSLNIENY